MCFPQNTKPLVLKKCNKKLEKKMSRLHIVLRIPGTTHNRIDSNDELHDSIVELRRCSGLVGNENDSTFRLCCWTSVFMHFCGYYALT